MKEKYLMPTVYGTQFEELEDEEKTSVSKKPKGIQDEIVTDERGRRRFHGAFTGGFSAGYFNTAGSKHGWVPQTFKSSREERAERQTIEVEDIMDEEDFGEFGIAAKKIRTKSDFMDFLAVPGEGKQLAWERSALTATTSSAVDDASIGSRLNELLRPINDSIGVRLLKQMGWRPGKGIGPKMNRRALERQRVRDAASEGKSIAFDEETVAEVEERIQNAEFAPEDVALVTFKPKEDSHGLGYTPLQETGVLAQNYGTMTAALKTSKRSKGIRGQAFGVGAFEDDDEDIYTNFDLTQYDFEVGASSSSAVNDVPKFDSSFIPATKKDVSSRRYFSAPMPPHNYRPVRRTGKIELAKDVPENLLSASDRMTPFQRAKFLGSRDSSVLEMLNEKDREFLKVVRKETDIREKAGSSRHRATRGEAEPFEEEPLKAHRYRKYVQYIKRGIPFPEPIELTRLEWEKELADFQNALTPELRALLPEVRTRQKPLAKIDFAKPIAEHLQSRFAKEGGSTGDPTLASTTAKQSKLDAVKAKKFGELTRTKYEWHPVKDLCKRFNVPDPYPQSNLTGALGIPRKMAKATTEYSLMDLGLPSTEAELETRRNPSRFDQAGTKKEPIEEPKLKKVEPENQTEEQKSNQTAPLDFMRALFEDLEFEEEFAEDEPEILEQPPPIKPEPIRPLFTESERKKVVTILDLVEDDDVYGPVPPPQNSAPVPENTNTVTPTMKTEAPEKNGSTAELLTLSDGSSSEEERPKKTKKRKKQKDSKKKKNKHKDKKIKKRASSVSS